MSHRLLNSSKTNIVKINKILIDEIDSAVLSSIKTSYQKNTFPVLHGLGKPRTNKLHHLYVLMWNISIHLSPVIYLKNRLNLQNSLFIFLLIIIIHYKSQKNPFLKVQHPGLKRVVLVRILTFQWVISVVLKNES